MALYGDYVHVQVAETWPLLLFRPGNKLALVHAGTKQPAWICRPKVWRPWLLQKLKMKEQVATSLDHWNTLFQYVTMRTNHSRVKRATPPTHWKLDTTIHSHVYLLQNSLQAGGHNALLLKECIQTPFGTHKTTWDYAKFLLAMPTSSHAGSPNWISQSNSRPSQMSGDQ